MEYLPSIGILYLFDAWARRTTPKLRDLSTSRKAGWCLEVDSALANCSAVWI